MSDGWETRRTQVGRGKYADKPDLERSEWVVLKLATTGVVKFVEVDTAFHPGNYPVVSSLGAYWRSGRVLIVRPVRSKLLWPRATRRPQNGPRS